MWKYWWNKKTKTWDMEIDEIDTRMARKLDEKYPRVTDVEAMIHIAPTITNDVEENIHILEAAFKMDATVKEACTLAWISEATYYKRINEDPTLKRRLELAKDWSKMIAHAAIYKKMSQWDAKIALQFLKLRDKRYKEVWAMPWDIEWEDGKAPIVQFISVDTTKWVDGTKTQWQTDTEQKLSSEWYANTSESNEIEDEPKQTPWENEEQVLRNLASWASNNE